MSGQRNTIRIGGAAGFWGDSMLSAPQLVRFGRLDYLTFDYLAEITMSIVARARAVDPKTGYAVDFVEQTLRTILKDCKQQGVRIVANAGGVNPDACAEAIRRLAASLDLSVSVAIVKGDDLVARAEAFRAQNTKEMFSGAAFPDNIMSINAYLGALPIAAALDGGADVVITGRCADSALTLGICMHSFGWSSEDYDLLSAGSLAGHVIECGAQATGGLFTDWEEVADGWANIGYPIVEVSRNGSFVVEKPPNTGGVVSIGSVSEQIVYEIADPRQYILPDVVCDFADVRLEQIEPEKVRVSGARGSAPTQTYKVSATYQDGYRLGLYISITGIDADRKARATGEAVLNRCAAMLERRNQSPFTETSLEVIGAEANYGANRRIGAVRECVLKLSAKHSSATPLKAMLREATSAGTSMAPGTSGMGGNRPKPLPVVRLFSFLVPKQDVPIQLDIDGKVDDIRVADGVALTSPHEVQPEAQTAPAHTGETRHVPLVTLAWARSGDKGDNSNIGVIARRPEYLPWIRAALTPDVVAEYFAHAVDGSVSRFDLPGLNAINLVMTNALGGGGIASLRNDPQGKAMGQILLDIPIEIPATLLVQ